MIKENNNNGNSRISKWIFSEIDYDAKNTVNMLTQNINESNHNEKITVNKEIVEDFYNRILSNEINISDVLEVHYDDWLSRYDIKIKDSFNIRVDKKISNKNRVIDRRTNRNIKKLNDEYNNWKNSILFDKILNNNVKIFQTKLNVMESQGSNSIVAASKISGVNDNKLGIRM